MPGQLPKVAFSGRIKPFQMRKKKLFLVFLKSEYSTKLDQLKSINKGQSLHLREGFQKKRQIIHILWIGVLPPPPLSTLAKVNNIHTKEFSSTFDDLPPRPLSTFIHINTIFLISTYQYLKKNKILNYG